MRSKLWLSLVAVLALATTANAQESGVKVGIGVSLSPLSSVFVTEEIGVTTVPGGTFAFYVPINIGENFKVEPELGFFRYKESYGDNEATVTQWRLAMGLLYVLRERESLRPYVSTSEKFNDADDSQTDFFVGLALGAEYYFSSHFTLGGEFQLNYVNIGSPEDVDDLSRNLFSSNGLIFIRWYF
jgi:hypothetical protein